MHYTENKGVFLWESRRNYSGGKVESSVFRSIEIQAQLMMSDRQEERRRGGG